MLESLGCCIGGSPEKPVVISFFGATVVLW